MRKCQFFQNVISKAFSGVMSKKKKKNYFLIMSQF